MHSNNNQKFLLSITGTGASRFRMDESSGIVYTSDSFDYEGGDTSFSSLTLSVTDSGGNQDTATLTVTFTDANDEAPVCSPMVYTISSVDENSAAGVQLSCF